jgi:hypothetical protein
LLKAEKRFSTMPFETVIERRAADLRILVLAAEQSLYISLTFR